MKNILHLLIVFLLFSSVACGQGKYSTQNPSRNVVQKHLSFKKFYAPATAYRLEKGLPRGYVRDGSVDYTAFIQKILNENRIVVMPNFPLKINKEGLKIQSDSYIYFQRKSQLIFDGPATGRLNDIVKIYNVKNVVIYNANIVGSRNITSKQSGEWSAGICILNSDNIKLYNTAISNTWGDGIYVGSEDGKYSSNILIDGGWIDQARRNGISVTSAKDTDIKNILISNTHGTLPECAIDVEPSLFPEIIQNVNFNNITTFNNKSASFAVNYNALNSDTKPYLSETSISINNLNDYNSDHIFIFSINPDNKKFSPSGSVSISNSNGFDTKNMIWKDDKKSNIKFIGENINYMKANKSRALKLPN